MKIIIENLKQQKECYRHLLQHLGEQQTAITNKDDEALMTAIKHKNGTIQTLHKLENELKAQMGHIGEDQQGAVRRGTESLRNEIVQSLEQLIAGEEQCQQSLTRQKDELEVQMTQFKKTKNLFKGYQDPSSAKGGGFKGNA